MDKKKEDKRCIYCGAAMVWNSSVDCCERSDYDDDDTAVIDFYECPVCGRWYEIWDPPREEREREYKDYWMNGNFWIRKEEG